MLMDIYKNTILMNKAKISGRDCVIENLKTTKYSICFTELYTYIPNCFTYNKLIYFKLKAVIASGAKDKEMALTVMM